LHLQDVFVPGCQLRAYLHARRFFKVRDVINKNFHILKDDPETSSIFSDNPFVSFRHSKNIRKTQVHSSLAQASASQKGTFPCLSSKCKTCDFVDSTIIVSAPKSEYHISTISRAHAPPPISSTAFHAVDVACFTLGKLEDV
jgi:hypothetical protein